MEHMTFLRNIPEGATAILVECRGESRAAMQVRLLLTAEFCTYCSLVFSVSSSSLFLFW
jgi:hypothetical protein